MISRIAPTSAASSTTVAPGAAMRRAQRRADERADPPAGPADLVEAADPIRPAEHVQQAEHGERAEAPADDQPDAVLAAARAHQRHADDTPARSGTR